MNTTIKAITKNFLNLLYPLHCATCKKILLPLNELGVCNFCKAQILQNPKPYCEACGRSLADGKALCAECEKRKFYFTRAYSACLYDGALKELIHLFKYKRKLVLTRILSGLMISFIEENPEILYGINTITAVPLEKRRLREREFNQSRALAFNISDRFGIPLSDTLEKIMPTRHQNELTRKERFDNLAGAFRVRKDAFVEGLKILLIDDVMTTGATLDECSRILMDAGAKEVRCFTLAR